MNTAFYDFVMFPPTKASYVESAREAFESYNSAQKKLLDNVSNALKYIPTSQLSRKHPRQD